MPKQPKFKTPLRQVRDALSTVEGHTITQPMFAKRLGVSPAYITAIEVRARPVTQAWAYQIDTLWGVDARSLLAPSATARASLGKTLEEGMRLWRQKGVFDKMNAARMGVFDDHFIPRLRALMRTAVAKKKAVFLQVRVELAIEEWAEEFGLKNDYAAEIKKLEAEWYAMIDGQSEAAAKVAKAKPQLKQSSPTSPARASNTSRRRKA